MKEYGIVYVYHHMTNGRYYVGRHRGSMWDGYTGSGIVWKKAKKKHGIDAFTRSILYEGPDYIQKEIEIIASLNAHNDIMSYNYSLPSEVGIGPGRMSEEAKRRISIATKGENNPFFGKKHSQSFIDAVSGDNHWTKRSGGHSDETKKKIGAKSKGRKHRPESLEKMRENHVGSAGYKHSAEAIAKIGAASKGRIPVYNIAEDRSYTMTREEYAQRESHIVRAHLKKKYNK